MNKIFSRIAFLTTKQVGIFALIMGGLYWYTLFDDGSSLDPQIASLKSSLQEQEAKKVETETALKMRDHLQETLADLTAKYEGLSRLVPTEMSSSELNRQIDQLRKTSRINQLSRKPSDTIKGSILYELPVEMKFVGAYNDIAQFVYQASTTEKVMLVKKLKITSPEAYDGRLNFDISISAFRLATPEEAAAANSGPAGQ